MIRIVYLLESTDLSGGVQVVLLQADALARRGHRVSIVSPAPAPDWHSLGRARFERSTFRESRELESADVRVATFWTTVAPAREGARVPVFHLCQGYEGGFSFYAHLRSQIEAAYRAPTRKLTVSATLASKLEELGFGPAENVGQAFDPAGFSPAGDGGRSGPPVVLVVGPYEADVKGVSTALEGLALWRRTGAVFRVRRVSTAPVTESERSFGLVDEYHHALPPARMPAAYRASDIFVGPARKEEGFGLPVLEALACGLPCLLSDTAGHREIAGEAAGYFREGDASGLAEKLPTMSGAGARERSREAGPRIAARYDTASVAEKLERAFETALAAA